MKIVDNKLILDEYGIFNKPSASKNNAVEFSNFSSEAQAMNRVSSLVGTKNLKKSPVSGGKKVVGNGTTLYVMKV